jgi:hypothetical protein
MGWTATWEERKMVGNCDENILCEFDLRRLKIDAIDTYGGNGSARLIMKKVGAVYSATVVYRCAVYDLIW